MIAVFLAASCDGTTSGPNSSSIGGRAEDQGFVLIVAIPMEALTSSTGAAPIATLTWLGPDSDVRLAHSANGPVLISFEEVGGTRKMSPATLQSCGLTTFQRGAPVAESPDKGVVWNDPDPNAAFYKAFAREPGIRLPSGRWRIVVSVDGSLGGCGGQPLNLHVPLEVVVP